jgi:ABC-type glycerol-3-phosphate transport system permease component
MAIIGNVEARSWGGRLMQLGIVVVLAIGAVTMLYPFLVMVSGSFRSEMDISDMTVVPRFWYDDQTLYQKFLETTYNQNPDVLNEEHQAGHFAFNKVDPPTADAADVEKLRNSLAAPEFPRHWQALGGVQGNKTVPENLRELRVRLSHEFHGDLEAFGKAVGTTVADWQGISFVPPDWLDKKYDYPDNWIYQTYFKMLEESDPGERLVPSLSGRFLKLEIYPKYDRYQIKGFNEAHGMSLASYSAFRLPERVPAESQAALRREWLDFVREELNCSFIVLEGVSQESYATFQREVVGRTGAAYRLTDGTRWLRGEEREAYERFLQGQSPERLRLVGPEFRLKKMDVPRAVAGMQYQYAMDHKGALRWAYSVRNYVTVIDELVMQGRILTNTAVFCGLAIVLALLINPIAAYALSRYRPVATYKILLFLMGTIAFPPMVTLIPQFILLRKLHLMNTFTALLIPLAANGYMIFLLKGFFDSLPQELYEAARLDGAGEVRMFFQITMALSKPILAVLALGTFTAAYMTFLYAILVAPDENMWLIGVWLYQFQQRSSSSAVYAAVLIASIPTFAIFLFTQRTIMRGIVVPSEK